MRNMESGAHRFLEFWSILQDATDVTPSRLTDPAHAGLIVRNPWGWLQPTPLSSLPSPRVPVPSHAGKGRNQLGRVTAPRGSGSAGTSLHGHWWFWTETTHFWQEVSKRQLWSDGQWITQGRGREHGDGSWEDRLMPQGGSGHVNLVLMSLSERYNHPPSVLHAYVLSFQPKSNWFIPPGIPNTLSIRLNTSR